MPPTSANYELADLRCDGRLAEILTAAYDRGDSTRRIAAALHIEHGVDVTYETVRVWLRLLRNETKAS